MQQEESNRSCYARAFALFKKGKREEALSEFHALAAGEYAPAQVFVGWAYEAGEGVQADANEARRWYQAATDAGDPRAAYYLGSLTIRQGKGHEGVKLIEQSAARGYAPAIYRLGLLYAEGVCVGRDQDKAVRYLNEASLLGHPFAQREVAVRLLRGQAGFRGILRAVLWFCQTPWIAFRLVWADPDSDLLQP